MHSPRRGREKVYVQLARGIIGLKHRLGMGMHWSSQLADELHQLARRRFQKNATCLPNWSTCHHTRDQTVATNTFSL